MKSVEKLLDKEIDIYDFIKEEMENQGLKPIDIAKATGITDTCVRNYIKKKRHAMFYTLEHILNCLGYELVVKKVERMKGCSSCTSGFKVENDPNYIFCLKTNTLEHKYNWCSEYKGDVKI